MIMTKGIVQIEGITADVLLSHFDKIDRIEKMLCEMQGDQKEQPADGNEYLTKLEVCDLLKVSKNTLTLWNKTKVLRNKKIGNRVYYRRSDIDKLI